MKYVLGFAVGLGGILAGFIAGALVGMDLFGNYFVNATFFGNRGYEAGFWYGGIAGAFTVLLLGTGLYRAVRRRGGDGQKR